MRAAVLLLAGCAVLAACKPEPTTPVALNEAESQAAGVAPDVDKTMNERWDSLFGNPTAASAAAKEFGYQLGGYTAAGSNYRVASPEVTLSGDKPAVLVTSDFLATGPKADRLDTVTFKFNVAQMREPRTQRDAEPYRTPARVVAGFLSRFGVSTGDDIRGAIMARKSASATMFNTNITVDAQPIAGAKPGDAHLTVTFHRTGANRPANS